MSIDYEYECPDPPYEGIIGTCALSIRKTDKIMRVLLDDGTAIDVNVGRLTDIPARKGDRVGLAVKKIETGYYLAVYCRNLETNREFLFEEVYLPSGGCYIVSMVFGQNTTELRFFRNFRDQILANHLLGRIFTEIYYKVSPRLVRLNAIRILTPIVERILRLFMILLERCKLLDIQLNSK